MNYTSENENESISYDIGGCLIASIIKNRHGKLSIWESIRYTHARLYQKSAIKLVTIKHLSRNASNQKSGCFYYFITKILYLGIHPCISPYRCNTLLEWQRKRITRDGLQVEYTKTRKPAKRYERT